MTANHCRRPAGISDTVCRCSWKVAHRGQKAASSGRGAPHCMQFLLLRVTMVQAFPKGIFPHLNRQVSVSIR